jgi:hypothetical protein
MDLRKNIILLIFVFFSKHGLGNKPFKMILDLIFVFFSKYGLGYKPFKWFWIFYCGVVWLVNLG